MYAPKCASCGLSITPAEGTNETIRIVAMEKDFHVECYVCEDCGTQLSDEAETRAYPLGKSLLCNGCHVKRVEMTQLDQVLMSSFTNIKTPSKTNDFIYSNNHLLNQHHATNGHSTPTTSAVKRIQTENL